MQLQTNLPGNLASDEDTKANPDYVAYPSPVSNPASVFGRTLQKQRAQKRKRAPSEDDIDCQRSTDGRRQRPCRTQACTSDHLLACPFVKHDPFTSHQCWDFGADSLARVKEHLRRRHEKGPHCPRCFALFDSSRNRDAHLRADTPCAKLSGERCGNWMTTEAAWKIKERSKRKDDPEVAWAHLYSVIFPGEKVPSPYVEDISQLSMQRVRETVVNDLVQYIQSTLDTLETDKSTLIPSATRTGYLSHLRKAADTYIASESGKDVCTSTLSVQDSSHHESDMGNWFASTSLIPISVPAPAESFLDPETNFAVHSNTWTDCSTRDSGYFMQAGVEDTFDAPLAEEQSLLCDLYACDLESLV